MTQPNEGESPPEMETPEAGERDRTGEVLETVTPEQMAGAAAAPVTQAVVASVDVEVPGLTPQHTPELKPQVRMENLERAFCVMLHGNKGAHVDHPAAAIVEYLRGR